jgi:glycosyltransferase involved in cell wall biosynthesis
MNPGRGKKSEYKPARVTLAVLTYLPEQAGYFEHRLETTRLCIESLVANTPRPYDLMVFDNGSCKELIDLLCAMRDAGKIHYLFLSNRNIGKIGALQFIFNSTPGEIVAYTDDDVFFLPGWLDAHLKIIETYPSVGQVTGFYIRPHMSYGNTSALAFAEKPDVKVERGLIIPKEWEQHYIDNMGRTWEKYNEEIKGLEDVALTYKGVEALVSAGHHQFVVKRDIMLEALPKEWTGVLMGKMRDLDSEVDRMGYSRLTTRLPVTRLIGNIVSPEMAAEARSYGIDTSAKKQRETAGFMKRIYRLSVVQALARRVYNFMFRIINS